MSLALAIDQIQRPTWWTFEAPKRGTGILDATVQEKRAVMLKFMRDQKRKLTTRDLMDEFKLTNSQAASALRQFLDAGQVKKTKTRHDFAYWEAV